MKREILVKVIVDWDNYDDFSDEQILEDTGIYEWLKEGVDITIEKKQPASGSLSKKIPTVQELREAAKDYPDTFLNGALYVVDKYLDAKQPVSGLLILFDQMIKEENEALGKYGFYNQYNRETHANNKYCLVVVKSLIERRFSNDR